MTAKAPAIDILLAVYNGEKYLPEFLDSLLAQSLTDFRLVVSDNKSTDGTLAVLEAYVGRFAHGVVILPPPLETVSACHNFARVTLATKAPYVMYADADDIWLPNKVARTFAALRTMEEHHGAQTPLLIHTDLAIVDRNLKPIHPSYWSYQKVDPSRDEVKQLLIRNCVTGCTMMMNRALVELIRPIPEIAPMHDHWCALNAAAFGQIEALAEPLIAYRQHGANDTGASRWGLSFILRRLRSLSSPDGPRSRLRSKAAQAQALLDQHGDVLDPDKRRTVETMASMFEAGFLARRWRIIRHGLWDDGVIRTIGLLAIL